MTIEEIHTIAMLYNIPEHIVKLIHDRWFHEDMFYEKLSEHLKYESNINF